MKVKDLVIGKFYRIASGYMLNDVYRLADIRIIRPTCVCLYLEHSGDSRNSFMHQASLTDEIDLTYAPEFESQSGKFKLCYKHEPVNVSFMQVKMVCKHCDQEVSSGNGN